MNYNQVTNYTTKIPSRYIEIDWKTRIIPDDRHDMECIIDQLEAISLDFARELENAE